MIVGDADSNRLLHGEEATAAAAFASRSGGEACAAAKRALAYWVRANARRARDRIPLKCRRARLYRDPDDGPHR